MRKSALRGALHALIERHAVLRTTYETVADGSFTQRVRAAPGDALERVAQWRDDFHPLLFLKC